MLSHPHLCNVTDSQLIIIDIQEKFSQVMPEKVLRRVINHTNLLSTAASLLSVPTITTRQYPKGLGDTLSTISDNLPDNALQIDKTSFSCLGQAEFVANIKNDQVILTGMESHICVLQTAIELQQQGKSVFVVADAICSRRLENYHNAVERMQSLGITITNAESVIFEWLRDANHEHFRAVSALVR